MFDYPFIIPVLALLIPIVAIIAKSLRRWQELDLEAARADVELRRKLRSLDEVERRVADMELYVTSPEFELNRTLNTLAEKP